MGQLVTFQTVKVSNGKRMVHFEVMAYATNRAREASYINRVRIGWFIGNAFGTTDGAPKFLKVKHGVL